MPSKRPPDSHPAPDVNCGHDADNSNVLGQELSGHPPSLRTIARGSESQTASPPLNPSSFLITQDLSHDHNVETQNIDSPGQPSNEETQNCCSPGLSSGRDTQKSNSPRLSNRDDTPNASPVSQRIATYTSKLTPSGVDFDTDSPSVTPSTQPMVRDIPNPTPADAGCDQNVLLSGPSPGLATPVFVPSGCVTVGTPSGVRTGRPADVDILGVSPSGYLGDVDSPNVKLSGQPSAMEVPNASPSGQPGDGQASNYFTPTGQPGSGDTPDVTPSPVKAIVTKTPDAAACGPSRGMDDVIVLLSGSFPKEQMPKHDVDSRNVLLSDSSPEAELPEVESPKRPHVGQSPEIRSPKRERIGQGPKIRSPKRPFDGQSPKIRSTKRLCVDQDPEIKSPKRARVDKDPEVRSPKGPFDGQSPKVRSPKRARVDQDPEIRSPKRPRVEQPHLVSASSSTHDMWNQEVTPCGPSRDDQMEASPESGVDDDARRAQAVARPTDATYAPVGRLAYGQFPSGFRRRTMVLAWMSEKCEELSCRRETFHLAADYLDRYTAKACKAHLNDLPLVGAACLLIAIKVEDSKYKGIKRLLRLTKQVCKSVDRIFDCERTILETINWKLHPVTCVTWLARFLEKSFQVLGNEETEDLYFLEKEEGHYAFVNMARLVDLCVMDSGSLDFSYQLITATALFHFSDIDLVTDATGFTVQDLYQCIQWMEPVVRVVAKFKPWQPQVSPKVVAQGAYTVHRHSLDDSTMDWLVTTADSPPVYQHNNVTAVPMLDRYLPQPDFSSDPEDD